jgi:hypothetical protein
MRALIVAVHSLYFGAQNDPPFDRRIITVLANRMFPIQC